MACGSPQPRCLRVCFVGCGNIASYHAAAAIATGRVRVTCLVDPKPSRRAEVRGKLEPADACAVAEFDSLEEALSSDPHAELFEACDIMVPSWLVNGMDLHEQVTSLALRARRHVLLEKPIAVTTKAAERLIALHKDVAGDQVFAAAENARFWPEVLEAKACIDRGGIGEVITARAKYWESAGGEWACDYMPGTWRCDPDKLPAASFTYDGASHWIRPLRMWMGEVDRVVGLSGRTLEHMPGTSWSQHILSFRSGKSAIFESLLAPKAISDQPFFTIQGTLGEIVIDGFAGGCRLYRQQDAKGAGAGETAVAELCHRGWDAGYEGEYADFVAAILDGTPCQGLVSEALEDLRVVAALFKAAEAGQWEPVGARHV